VLIIPSQEYTNEVIHFFYSVFIPYTKEKLGGRNEASRICYFFH